MPAAQTQTLEQETTVTLGVFSQIKRHTHMMCWKDGDCVKPCGDPLQGFDWDVQDQADPEKHGQQIYTVE